MNTSLPLALHNPSLLPPETLLAEFTARRPLLEELLGIVRQNQPGQPPQHVLLLGARGMGKSTTLWAVAHRVRRDSGLARQWQPVVFDEESRRVGDLTDFWLEALRQWEYATATRSDRVDCLLDSDDTGLEERAREAFVSAVDKSGRRALLLIDNFNDLLGAIHDPVPLHRLRAFLMEDSRVTIIGSATRYFDEITALDRPFFDFFRVFDLRPLTLDEMKACLHALAESRGDPSVDRALEERAGTVQALHLLTGGNPRLIKTFYRLFAEGLRGDVRADLERLLDEFTPYFKAVLDGLPCQQQRILDALALAWDPVEVRELARVTRLPSNQVSAQLRALAKGGLISEAGLPKRKTYLLADRFSNIHYLMRHGRAARNRFDWFIAIVRLVFPDQEHETVAKAARQAAECGLDGLRDARDLMTSALGRSATDDERHKLVAATLRESWGQDKTVALSEWLDLARTKHITPEAQIVDFFSQMPKELRKQLGYHPEDARWWSLLAGVLEERQAWSLAEAAYRKTIELDPESAAESYHLGNLLLRHLNRPAEAEDSFRKAIALSPEHSPIRQKAWNNLGVVLARALGQTQEAEKAYRKSIDLDPKCAISWNNLGNLLQSDLGRYQEAESAYQEAVEIEPENGLFWLNFACLLDVHLHKYEQAEAALRQAVSVAPNSARYRKALAEFLARQSGRELEVRDCLVKAISLEPDFLSAYILFLSQCGGHAEDWQSVLPSMAPWCAAHPESKDVLRFTMEGLVRLARLARPEESLAILEALPDPSPFETLIAAFRAHADREYLYRLAPERQAVIIELLKRLPPPNAEHESSMPRREAGP